jgi:hypothetical protein
MINVIERKCLECDLLAYYNYYNEKEPLYCSSHKKSNMFDVKHKTCKIYLCGKAIFNIKYEGYCLSCFINMFPNKPVVRNYKTKEFAVVEYINKNINYVDITHNKRIQNGCSRKIPDLLIDLGYQVIIIEIDEFKHNTYDNICDNRRIMELSLDVNHRPIILIRFNPDSYKNKGKNIGSCWEINKQGVSVVKKSKEKEWDDRLKALKNQIEFWINPENKTEKTIELIQLFYDI